MTYAFTFDASACSGCKACQAACKDKNQLPVGVLWRRVYEVSSGGWQQHGAAWTNTVFAYNMSIACNHCEHPKCAGVCPVDAYVVRPDGIVYIDESKCVGCGYCAWACPYAVPQYNHELGHMTKCNFCFDNIDAGLPPACVAACPMRVLNYQEVGNTPEGYIPLWTKPAIEHPFPMSPISRTEPHLAVKPHSAMNLGAEKNIANHEEIHPRKESAWAEAPLIIFTLLAQLSVGAFWSMLWMPFGMTGLFVVGTSLGLGMFTSFAHMGTKRNAWRVLTHLRKSWLSREILSASLFGAGWLVVMAETVIFHRTTTLLLWIVAIPGFYLIHSMSNVYRLPSKPEWNTWRTNAVFMVSAVLLGQLVMAVILTFESQTAGGNLPNAQWKIIGFNTLALLVLQMIMIGKYHSGKTDCTFHLGLSLAAILAVIITFLLSGKPAMPGSLLAFSVVLSEEITARWMFYHQEI